jgi:hypothetical protein
MIIYKKKLNKKYIFWILENVQILKMFIFENIQI